MEVAKGGSVDGSWEMRHERCPMARKVERGCGMRCV